MIFRIGNLLFQFLMMVSLNLTAQEKWTLNECINYAIKNNLKVHAAGLDEKVAVTNYNQSKWNLLPGISGGADAGMNYGRSVDPNTNGIVNTSFFNNSYYLGASVDLFRGFMLQNQIRYQQFRKEVAVNNRLSETDDLAFTVMNAFFYVLYFEELMTIANEQKSLSELNVKKMQILVTTGLKSQTDLLEVRANYEKDELFCIQTANNIESTWITLKKAMNLPPDQVIKLDFSETEPEIDAVLTANIPELFVRHTAWSPVIQSYELDWKASQKNINVKKAGFFPSVKLQASYNTGFYQTNKDNKNEVIAYRDQIKNNANQMIGATLTVPVFNKNAVRFDVERSRIDAEQAKTRLEIARQNLLYQMEGDYNELTASWKEFQQAKRQLQADTLAYQASQKKFNQGMITAVDLNTTKNRMANTSSQVLHSKLTYAMKKRILDFYGGKRFWEE
jgi:outer membrane protein